MAADPSIRLGFILTDIVWRGIWAILTLGLLALAVVWLSLEISSLEWQGPDLTVANPIILVTAIQQLWQMYSPTLFWTAILLAFIAAALWLTLEAYFRGGREQFWTFLGSAACRLAILTTAAFLLTGLSYIDSGRWMILLGACVMFGVALLVVIAETLIRRDAVELWGADLFGVLAVIGGSFVVEVLSLAIFLGASMALILSSSRISEIALALSVSVMGGIIWSIFHSYLLAVRLSTIDIMRRDVRGV
jgi:hypothetical protein